MKTKMGETSELDEYPEEVEALIEGLCDHFNVEIFFLSDLSYFSDFAKERPILDSFYEGLSKRFGVKIEKGDSILAVAKRLRAKKTN